MLLNIINLECKIKNILYNNFCIKINESDIDFCFVSSNENIRKLLSFILYNVYLKKYDVRIFSELPLI